MRIEQFAEVVGGGTPSRKNDEYFGGDVSWITPRDLAGYQFRYIASGATSLTKLGLKESSARLLPKDAVLFSSRAPIGYVALARNPLATNQGFRSLVCDRQKALPSFIYYALKYHLPAIEKLASGTTFKEVSGGVLKRFEMPIPPLEIQNKIASVLSGYDDLIEKNLRRIEILEEMAQLLYREWFVNFRFPGHEGLSLVESPLGRIPSGWRVEELSKVTIIVDCLHSKKPSEASTSSDRYGVLLHIWNIPGGGRLDLSKKFYIRREDYDYWTRNIEVMEGDCVVTNVGRIGDFAQIPAGTKFAIGRNMTAVRPIHNGLSPTYLIEYLRSPYMDRERTAKRDSGTIMDSLNVKGIVKLLVPVPQQELMREFELRARPLRHFMELLIQKNALLRQIRDLLLPKLISGQLDVSDLDINVAEDLR